MFQIAHEPHAQRVYGLIWSATWVLGWGIVGAIGLVTPELFGILTSSAYVAAQSLFPWLLVSQLMILMQYPAAIGIYLERRTGLLSVLYLVGLMVNIASGIAFVTWWSSTGAAAAWCLANTTITLATWLTNQRLYPLPWSPTRFVVVAAVGVFLIQVGVAFAGRPWGIGAGVRVAGGLGALSLSVALVIHEADKLRRLTAANAAVRQV